MPIAHASENSTNTFKTYLKLIRAPGIFSIITNTLAAFIVYQYLTQTPLSFTVEYLLILIISLFCYQLGMITNDIADIKEDSIERAFRPLPSGSFSIKFAQVLSIVFIIIALFTASFYSLNLFIGTSLLILTILSYNFISKNNLLGPYNMGTVRFLNWLLVIWLGTTLNSEIIFIALIVMLFTTFVTVISQFETNEFPKHFKPYLYFLITLPLLLTIYLTIEKIFSLPGAIILMSFFVWLFYKTAIFEQKQANDVQLWVMQLLKSMVILDGLILIAIDQWLIGLLCISLLFFSGKLAKTIYMT
jgi:4-hydroxybenzoate polyprenyltransferase